MKFATFTIPVFHAEEAAAELNDFCARHRVTAIEKEFIQDGQASCWAVWVTYRTAQEEPLLKQKKKVDYREVLDEHDFAVFVKLRALRKELAEKEAVPAYALFTNEQLASMIRNRVDSLAAMAEIDGVGKARLEKYGQQFLGLLQELLPSASG